MKLFKKLLKILTTMVVVAIFHHFWQNSNLKTANKTITDGLIKGEILEPLELKDMPLSFGDILIEPVKFHAQKSETSSKLITRKGLLTLRKNPKANLLICHGFGCDKIEISFLRTFFPSYNILIFDFRAHGEKNEKECCTFGKNEAYEVIAAAKFLKTHHSTKNLKTFGYGFSMGAASLIQAQSKESLFEGLILDGPFDSSRSLVKKGLSYLKINCFGYTFDLPGLNLLEEYAFNPYVQPLIKYLFKIVANLDSTKTNSRLCLIEPAQAIKNINIPCFFIHCKNDEKIPVECIKNIFNNAPCYKKLWLTDGRKHCDSLLFHPEKYIYMTNQFLEQVLSQNLDNKENGSIIYDSEKL